MREALLKQGSFSWNELMTTDMEGAKAFYGELFGWGWEKYDEDGDMPYTVIKCNGEEVGGISPMMPGMPPGVPPHWGVYVTVDDIDKTVEKAEKLGGNILVPPMDIPNIGRFAVIQDPQGAALMAVSYTFNQESE